MVTYREELCAAGLLADVGDLAQLGLPVLDLGLTSHRTADLHELVIVVGTIPNHPIICHPIVLAATAFLRFGLTRSHRLNFGK